MGFYRATLETCSQAAGTVVVIDVLRAFTTSAYIFAAGAEEILLVSTLDEAFALRIEAPDSLLLGEVGGLPIEGFDFGNSPALIAGQDLNGRRLVQRTSAGTQGVVRSLQADTILAASFVCAGATVRCLRQLSPSSITFVITGIGPDGAGDEDAACADYLEARLRGEQPDTAPFLRRVRQSPPGRIFADPLRPEFPAADLELSAVVDRFDFAQQVFREAGRMALRRVEAA